MFREIKENEKITCKTLRSLVDRSNTFLDRNGGHIEGNQIGLFTQKWFKIHFSKSITEKWLLNQFSKTYFIQKENKTYYNVNFF